MNRHFQEEKNLFTHYVMPVIVRHCIAKSLYSWSVRRLWPVGREESLSCHTCCDTGMGGGGFGLIRRTVLPVLSRLFNETTVRPLLSPLCDGPSVNRAIATSRDFPTELGNIQALPESPEQLRLVNKADWSTVYNNQGTNDIEEGGGVSENIIAKYTYLK